MKDEKDALTRRDTSGDWDLRSAASADTKGSELSLSEQQRDVLRAVAEHAEQMVPEALDLLRREKYVFRRFPRDMKAQPPVGDAERWEALAFSLFSCIGQVSSMAVRALNDVSDLEVEAATSSDARFTPTEKGTADGSATNPLSSSEG